MKGIQHTRFFKFKKKSDRIISLALMAYHRGASISGIQNTLKAFFHDKTCAECIIKWKKELSGKVCAICFHSESQGKIIFCSKRGMLIRRDLEDKCKFFISKLLAIGMVEQILDWFKISYEWRPYGKVGHPNKPAKLHPKTTRNLYCRKYYRTHPNYAKTLLKHPENLYQRLKIRDMSPEQKAEHKKKRHREWASAKNRRIKGNKFNEKMSRRGRKGAEARWGRKYN